MDHLPTLIRTLVHIMTTQVTTTIIDPILLEEGLTRRILSKHKGFVE